MSPNQALFTSIQQSIITYPPFPALHILLITDVRQWKQLVQTVPHLFLSEVISCITPDPVKCINTTKQSMIKLRFGFRFNQDHLRCCTPKMQEEHGCWWESVHRVLLFVWLYLSYLPKRRILHLIFQNKLHYSMLLWCSVRRSRSRFCLPRQRQGCMQLQSNAIKLLKLKMKQMCSPRAWLEWKWGRRRHHYGKKCVEGFFIAAKPCLRYH